MGRTLGLSSAGAALAAVAYTGSGFFAGHNVCCWAYAGVARTDRMSAATVNIFIAPAFPAIPDLCCNRMMAIPGSVFRPTIACPATGFSKC